MFTCTLKTDKQRLFMEESRFDMVSAILKYRAEFLFCIINYVGAKQL